MVISMAVTLVAARRPVLLDSWPVRPPASARHDRHPRVNQTSLVEPTTLDCDVLTLNTETGVAPCDSGMASGRGLGIPEGESPHLGVKSERKLRRHSKV